MNEKRNAQNIRVFLFDFHDGQEKKKTADTLLQPLKGS